MRKVILLFCLSLFCFNAQADSPLTSTNFFTVYEEYEIVQDALSAKGKLTNDIMIYLSDRAYPIDVKVAVVNALGWNFNGQNNYDTYLDFVEMRTGMERTDRDFYKKIDADEILCLAYLKAMDNYFDVKKAKNLSELALIRTRRSQRSYTFHLIDALIGAQTVMESSWCEVYKSTQKVKENSDLRYDFPWEADDIVFEYMSLYKSSCKE